jgi:hypothetical protein
VPTVPLRALVLLAGVGQIVLALASLAIPRVLRFREETAKLRPLLREMFWTYAGYILCTNLSIGLLSALAPEWLLDGSPLAAAVTAYITVYWAARVVIQFVYFDRSDAPPGPHVRLAEALLVALFLYLTAVYALAFAANLRGGAG